MPESNKVEIVGWGTATNRKNIRTLDTSGNEVLAGKLTLGAQPTTNMDAATKQYVDAAVAGGGGGQTGVSSVNGQAGNVILTASDVNALPDTFLESDPTVPAWAKEPNKPTYTAIEVGAVPDGVNISNRNLLDNPWWGSGEVVNQREITGTPANQAYCIDRWIYSTGSNSNAISLGANGITFTPVSGQYMWMNQHMANASWFTGKTVTGSIMLADGTIYSGTVKVTTGNDYMYFNDSVGFRFYWDTSNNIVLRVGTTKTIRALKVELGSYSTLANDVPPDYEEELRKCMYYFQRIRQKNSYTLCVGFGEAMNSTTNIRITIPTAVPMRHQSSAMRAVPTGTGTMQIVGNGQLLPVTAVSGLGVTGNAVVVNVTVSTAGAYNHIYGLRFTNNSTYIDLSADL